MGRIIAMIHATISDMIPFTIVLVLLLGGGAFAMPLFMGNLDSPTLLADGVNSGHGFADPPKAFLTLYMWLNGDWDSGPLEDRSGALFYFYLFLFVTNIVMLNLLIAIMGATFERIKDNQKTQSRIVRAQMIHNIEIVMPDSEDDQKGWQKCLPRWMRPWCKDDPALNPVAILRVVRDDDTAVEDDKLTQMSKKVEALQAELQKRHVYQREQMEWQKTQINKILSHLMMTSTAPGGSRRSSTRAGDAQLGLDDPETAPTRFSATGVPKTAGRLKRSNSRQNTRRSQPIQTMASPRVAADHRTGTAGSMMLMRPPPLHMLAQLVPTTDMNESKGEGDGGGGGDDEGDD